MTRAHAGEQVEYPSAVWEDLLLTLKHSKLIILLVFITTVLGAYAALQFMTWRYEADATLLVKLGRENTELPVTVEKGGVLTTGVRREEINSEVQLLSSRYLIEQVVDTIGHENYLFEPAPPKNLLQAFKYYLKLAVRRVKAELNSLLILLGLRQELDDRQKVILAVERFLSVEREKDSDVIRIRLQLPEPNLAVRTIELLLELYLEQRIQVRQDENIRQFFENQVNDYELRLDTLRNLQEELKVKWNIDAVGEQRRLLLGRLHEIYGQLDELRKERNLIAEQERAMRRDAAAYKQLREAPSSIPPDTSVGQVKARLTELRMERIKLQRVYRATAAPMQKVDSEIGSLMQMLRRGLDSTIAGLEGRAAEIEAQIDRLNTGEDELKVVERQRLLAEQNYLDYSKRREDALVSEEFDQRRVSNISVLTPPAKPIKPVYPRKVFIMALTLPIGLLLGIGLALLLEYLNDRVRTARDLRGIPGLTYLGSFRSLKRAPG